MARDRVRLTQERDYIEKDFEHMAKERYRIAKEGDVALKRITKERDNLLDTILNITVTTNGLLE